MEPVHCQKCEKWETNLAESINNYNTYREKIRLATVIPHDVLSRKEVTTFAGITKYLVDKARETFKENGIYGIPDPYNGHPLQDKDIHNVTKTKRYLTRSIREMYTLFKEQNPQTKLGRSGFYSVRPRWLVPAPSHDICVCIYCENFNLRVTALKNLCCNAVTYESLKKLVLSLLVCDNCNLDCLFQECSFCPGSDGITIISLNLEHLLDDESEVTFAIWENNDLVRKTVTLEYFITVLSHWASQSFKDWKCTEKSATQKRRLILHGNFAENWTITLPNEIQSDHWLNQQISIFTAVCYLDG